MFCSKCGENLVEGTIFCPECGTNVGGNNNSVNNNPMLVQQSVIGGWVALVLGIIGVAYSAITISTDINGRVSGLGRYGYTYRPPLSGHEITMIAVLIISILVLVIGIILLVKPKLNVSIIGFAILSFFVPLVGLILYIVWRKDAPLKAKSCGIGALIGFILSILPLLFSVVQMKMAIDAFGIHH